MLKEVLSHFKPELCFRCNKCVSGCPVARIIDEYRPNRIVRLAYLGLIDELIKSELIWYCTQCFTCTERCPMEVAPADVIVALRNVASRNGFVHDVWKRMAMNILNNACILPEMGIATRDRKLVKRVDLGITVFKKTSRSIIESIYNFSKIPIKFGGEE